MEDSVSSTLRAEEHLAVGWEESKKILTDLKASSLGTHKHFPTFPIRKVENTQPFCSVLGPCSGAMRDQDILPV